MLIFRIGFSGVVCAALLAATPLGAQVPEPADTAAEPSEEEELTSRLWGYAFGDYYYKLAGDTALWGNTQYAGVEEGMNAVQPRRVYLGYDHDFSPSFGAKALLEANDRSTFANGSYGVFLKRIHLEWRDPVPAVPFTLRAGLVPTPMLQIPEGIWGYRAIERTLLDARGLGMSTDLGLSIEGSVAGERYGYYLLVGNGSGTREETSADKAAYGSTWARWFDGRLILEVLGAYIGAPENEDRRVGRVFIGSESEIINLGLEVAFAREANVAARRGGGRAPLEAFATSAFVSLPVDAVIPSTWAFARWDRYDPDRRRRGNVIPTTRADAYVQNFFVAGLDVRPDERVHIMPNVWINTYDARRAGFVERDPDVVGRLTLFFRF